MSSHFKKLLKEMLKISAQYPCSRVMRSFDNISKWLTKIEIWIFLYLDYCLDIRCRLIAEYLYMIRQFVEHRKIWISARKIIKIEFLKKKSPSIYQYLTVKIKQTMKVHIDISKTTSIFEPIRNDCFLFDLTTLSHNNM